MTKKSIDFLFVLIDKQMNEENHLSIERFHYTSAGLGVACG